MVTARISSILPARAEDGPGIDMTLSGGTITAGLDYRNLAAASYWDNAGGKIFAGQDPDTGTLYKFGLPSVVPSLTEFVDLAAAVTGITLAGGGTLRIPGGMTTGTLPANFEDVLLEYDGPENQVSAFSEGFAGRPAWAKKVFRSQHRPDHPDKQLYSVYVETRPWGSGKNGPPSTDTALGVLNIKCNWTQPTAFFGEIDGVYIHVYQGGPDAASSAPRATIAPVFRWARTFAGRADLSPSLKARGMKSAAPMWRALPSAWSTFTSHQSFPMVPDGTIRRAKALLMAIPPSQRRG